jgi:hypothetical protein
MVEFDGEMRQAGESGSVRKEVQIPSQVKFPLHVAFTNASSDSDRQLELRSTSAF